VTALEYILDGLEAELALERELGVRSVEIDRAVLSVSIPAQPAAAPPRQAAAPVQAAVHSQPRPPVRPAVLPLASAPAPAVVKPGTLLDFVFLHDRPLSAKGTEIIEKITVAMGKTSETAPVVHEKPIPRARIYVALGSGALKKWFPGRSASPGTWMKSDKGVDIFVTYSPEYFVRFTTVTPAVKKIKVDMWNSLKGVLQRLSVMR